jgi:hypothetical protein
MIILQFSVPQIFGVEFTNGYLENILRDPVYVHVLRMTNKNPWKGGMKMGVGSNNEILTI